MITITVTQADIDAGTPGNCWSCAVAIALKRVFGDCRPKVTIDMISIIRNAHTTVWDTPVEVVYFITDVDHKFPVKPITFQLSAA